MACVLCWWFPSLCGAKWNCLGLNNSSEGRPLCTVSRLSFEDRSVKQAIRQICFRLCRLTPLPAVRSHSGGKKPTNLTNQRLIAVLSCAFFLLRFFLSLCLVPSLQDDCLFVVRLSILHNKWHLFFCVCFDHYEAVCRSKPNIKLLFLALWRFALCGDKDSDTEHPRLVA